MLQRKNKEIFINCPFDSTYRDNFYAICFTIIHCGYIPRAALDINNSAEYRLEKIIKLIKSCDYAIHDLSMVQLDINTNLPRFNMPFECGIFYGINHISKKKREALLLEARVRETQVCLSDLLGIDPQAQQNDQSVIIEKVRNWIRAQEKEHILSGGLAIYEDYQGFKAEVPVLAKAYRLDPRRMDYSDCISLMAGYIKLLKSDPI